METAFLWKLLKMFASEAWKISIHLLGLKKYPPPSLVIQDFRVMEKSINKNKSMIFKDAMIPLYSYMPNFSNHWQHSDDSYTTVSCSYNESMFSETWDSLNYFAVCYSLLATLKLLSNKWSRFWFFHFPSSLHSVNHSTSFQSNNETC